MCFMLLWCVHDRVRDVGVHASVFLYVRVVACVCLRADDCVCMFVYVCVHACMYACERVCMCLLVCMHSSCMHASVCFRL